MVQRGRGTQASARKERAGEWVMQTFPSVRAELIA